MSRRSAGVTPELPDAPEVEVYPTGTAYVQGEPAIPHFVSPERAAELVGAPYPAFTLTPPDVAAPTPPDEEAAIPDPAPDAGPDSEV